MVDILPLSVGIGLIVGLVFVEYFGLSAGGMVVPGYIALNLAHPLTVALTILIGLLTFICIRGLSRVLIIFGRRRIALTVLIAFILGTICRQLITEYQGTEGFFDQSFTVIGFIIPGLISISIDRQGIVETLTTLLSAAVVVRLILIVFIGQELIA
jgi:poly-gamma-glutamate biosynthesis protein PgsC/CapC